MDVGCCRAHGYRKSGAYTPQCYNSYRAAVRCNVTAKKCTMSLPQLELYPRNTVVITDRYMCTVISVGLEGATLYQRGVDDDGTLHLSLYLRRLAALATECLATHNQQTPD